MIIQTKKEKIGHLLMHVCRERGKTADQFMTQSKIFRGQGMMLMFLSEHEGLTHSEIAERLNISPAAATKVIKRLEEEGYIKRQSDDKDERLSRVFMQEGGRAVISGIQSSFKKLDEQTFHNFGDEDLDRLEDYLHHILTNLKAG
ncbi:MarR family winged helix-turn-helix transcriptional regulator [Pelolinea submarina]|uniref:DNA-binding MarR family transcriptional regulator n=1 Tax=Pelolinea submarina TaxID=913107 RepID=A0A3E0A2U6_9CHLR|nr:MarR family transcriptional regulator [Pelolinea submarina]REG04671.1 DNA-binding MarR family transcriptional regulator [Pelolinea submarina]